MSTLLIANPAAGRGRGGRAAPIALEAARQAWPDARLAWTTGPGHAVELAARAAPTTERVLVVGGDGTVHEAANGIIDSGAACALSVVPVGTGNDLARQLGTAGLAPARAVAALARGRIASFDALRVGEEWAVNSCGAGLAARVARRVNGYRRLRGMPAYAAAVARTLLDREPIRLEVAWEGGRFEGDALLVEVGNGSTTGGGFRLVPDARPGDGRLDLCLVEHLRLGQILRCLPALLRARHAGHEGIVMGQGTHVSISTPEGPLDMHLDGELRTHPTGTVAVEVTPGCLSVLVAAA